MLQLCRSGLISWANAPCVIGFRSVQVHRRERFGRNPHTGSISQTLLLPNSVDEYMGPDNPVRFVDAFVEELDLQGAGFFRVEPNETGRPGYHPADLLKLYIYGYLNRVRSSRRLEAESRRNLEVMWLLRRLTPDFKTIADFRKDNRPMEVV